MSDLFTTSRGVLETRVLSPPTVNVSTKLAVFTHPWAPLGGNMDDPVFHALRPVFLSRGFHILLYNSRPSFSGVPEAEDLQELVQGVMNKLVQVDTLVLLGYSHGSLITSMHPVLPAPIKTSHILLSYPISVRSLITFFNGARYDSALHGLVQNPQSNVLILYGDSDQFTSLQRYEQWASELKTEAKCQLNIVMIGSDHFWRQAGEEMCDAVGRWLDAN